MNQLTPQELPPGEEEAYAEDASPKELLPEEAEKFVELYEAEMEPVETPPETAEVAINEEILSESTWYTNKKITRLWLKNQDCNSWATVSGLGWRKLANNSDSAVVALTMLVSHALCTKSNVHVNEDSAKKITEIYVW